MPMLFFDGGLALVFFAVWLFCIIDVITTPEYACRNLPKFVWLLIVILLPDVGAIAWLVAGRPWNAQPRDLPYRGNTGRSPMPAPPPRSARRPVSPDDDEEFLEGLRARAEEQRRRAREAQQRDEDTGGTTPTP
jgi:hypothetical protein